MRLEQLESTVDILTLQYMSDNDNEFDMKEFYSLVELFIYIEEYSDDTEKKLFNDYLITCLLREVITLEDVKRYECIIMENGVNVSDENISTIVSIYAYFHKNVLDSEVY